MSTLPRFVRTAAVALTLLCIMLAETSCQRPRTPRSSRTSPQRTERGTAARKLQELKEAREEVDRYARCLEAKDLASAGAPRMAVTVASRAVKTDPQHSAAYRLLGRGLLEQARFGEAAAAFRRTLQFDPQDRLAARGLQEALRLAELARSLPLRLKPGQRLLAIVETHQDSLASTFALIGVWEQYADGDWEVSRPEVRLFVSDGRRYRETFRTTRVAWGRSDVIGYYRTWVADLLGMGRQQMVLVSGWSGADHYREVLDVFLPQGDSLRHIVHVAGEVPGGYAPFEVMDLDMDGRREIEVRELLEYMLAGGAIWRDVFEYDGRRYRLATSRFPSIVRDNVAELESRRKFYLKEVGHVDDRVLEYLARGHRYLRDVEKAPLTTRRRRGRQ